MYLSIYQFVLFVWEFQKSNLCGDLGYYSQFWALHEMVVFELYKYHAGTGIQIW